MRGLDPTLKSVRLANFLVTLRKETLQLTHAAGALHPGLLSPEQLEIVDDCYGTRTVAEVFGQEPEWTRPSEADRAAITELMKG
jgi:hypothetical protein